MSASILHYDKRNNFGFEGLQSKFIVIGFPKRIGV